MDIATSQPPLVFLLVFSEVLSDFITLLWAMGSYNFLGGWCLQDFHQGFTGGGQRITVVLLPVHTTTGLALFAVGGHYWTVPAYVTQERPDPLQSSIDSCFTWCVADSSWVSEVPWVVPWIASSFFRQSFSFPKIFFFFFIFYSTCALLAVLLSAGRIFYPYVWVRVRNLQAWFFNTNTWMRMSTIITICCKGSVCVNCKEKLST